MASPVKLNEVASLTGLGINPQSLTFNTCNMQSDKYICIRETVNGANSIVLVDVQKPSSIVRRPMVADSAVMNPVSKVVALRSSTQLQFFDFASRSKLKTCVMAEPVVFTSWITERTLGIVTPGAVWHWRVDDQNEPTKMFERHESMAGAQVIAYRADARGEWLVLVGIVPLPDARGVAGKIQLYSVNKKLSQAINGHAAAFANFKIKGFQTTLFAFAAKSETDEKSTFHVIEVGTDKKPPNAPKFDKQQAQIYYPPEMAQSDFPISIQVSSKFSIAYLITKQGYAHLYDLETATCIYQNRISDTTMFTSVTNDKTGGLMGVTRKGQLLDLVLDSAAVVPYVMSKLKDVDLATRMASRNGFPGADNLFVEQFRELFDDEDYQEAAQVAAESPAGVLRTNETIQMFKSIRAKAGQASPLLMYFNTLLDHGSLNKVESLEVTIMVGQIGKAHLLEKWLKEDKLDCTEELGDAIYRANPAIALAAYIKAKAHMRVIQCMIETGQTSKVPIYAKKAGMETEAMELVQMASNINPQAALELANSMQGAMVVLEKPKSTVNHKAMYETFIQKGLLQEATSYLLDQLGEDLPEWGDLQTACLSANLMNAPAVADAILQQDIWHQYDKLKIGMLCERAGLFQHALQNFSDISDVKRVITNTHVIDPDFIVQYFGSLAPEDGLDVLEELVKANPKGNLKLCVQIGAKYSDDMGARKLLKIFSSVKSADALFFYLGSIVNFSDDPEIHFAYIEASVQLGQFGETERVTRESNFYDPERVKNFLKDKNIGDPRPLINVCDRFGYVPEMVKFMVRGNKIKFVEGYVQRVNPLQCPTVVGSLLDLDIDVDRVKKLVMSVKNMVPVGELVEEVAKRGQLKILLQFLESKIADGATDEQVHSGVAQVYVDTNTNPQHFLETNAYYNSRVVGKFCERRDPFLAYVAYRRGKCDDDLLAVTENNSLFREQALYVVERESVDLWAKALREDNPLRKLFVDQVVSAVLPKTSQPEKVACAVQAFLKADLPDVLMELLENLVMNTANSSFRRNTNLQNLIILTAIKSKPERVGEYIRVLNNYDAADIAGVCLRSDLPEEAYTIYHKFEMWDEVIGVLIDHLKDFERAEEFAQKVDQPEVWSRLGIAMLRDGVVYNGIACLMRAKDPNEYLLVIESTTEHGTDRDWSIAVKYLRTARKRVKNYKVIDTEIIYGLCRTDQLGEVEEFLSQPNEAAVGEVGERCYDEEMWVAARLLLTISEDWALLAVVLVRLGVFEEAVRVAKKANRVKTWKLVCFGCVDAKEFRFARQSGVHVVIEVSELQEVLDYYQDSGHFLELIDLMDQSLGSDKAHPAMFTETAVLYTRYRQAQLMDFVKMWWQKVNIPKVIRACSAAYLWAETVFLHIQYQEYDNAAVVMMEHSADAWTESDFTDVMTKCGSLEVMYRAVRFYMAKFPTGLIDLLMVLAPRCEATRVIHILQDSGKGILGPLGFLPMSKPYLRRVQEANVPEINQALNDVLLQEENVDELNSSVDNFDNFERYDMARKLEKHKLIDMRQIAIRLFYRTGKFEHAIELAKKDKLWKEVINAANASADPELIEQLAIFFLDKGFFECFGAMLYTCYEHFPADVALELAWTRKKQAHSMPFMIQFLCEIGNRLMKLQEERKAEREREETAKKEAEEDANDDPSVLLFGLQPPQTGGAPMLTYPGPVPGGFMGANAVPQIGWTPQPGGAPNPAMHSTFAVAPDMSFPAPAAGFVPPPEIGQNYATQIL